MKIALGPIQYFWSADTVKDFYQEVVNWPVDIVYLGEVVCSKRQELKLIDWLYIGDMLEAAGKEVVLSTLANVTLDSEFLQLQSICDNGDFRVEANNLGAVRLIDARPFVIGPQLKSVEPELLKEFKENGAVRWIVPYDLSATMLATLQKNKPRGLETEVLVYGKVPLISSNSCFTACAQNVSKEECNLRCFQHPEGQLMSTADGESSLTINGTQIQSGQACNLIEEIEQLQKLQIDIIRLLPQQKGMQEIVTAFDQTRRGGILKQNLWGKEQWCNAYWHGQIDVKDMANKI